MCGLACGNRLMSTDPAGLKHGSGLYFFVQPKNTLSGC